jgi:hypothetical protein
MNFYFEGVCSEIINGFGGVSLQCANDGVAVAVAFASSARVVACTGYGAINKFRSLGARTTKGAATSDPIIAMSQTRIALNQVNLSVLMSPEYHVMYMSNDMECVGATLVSALPLQLLPCWRVVRLEKTLIVNALFIHSKSHASACFD